MQLSKGGTGFVTECKAADIGEDGKYTYTFTAPQDGWYMFELYGTTGVKYTVGTDKAGELSLSKPIKEVVQLETAKSTEDSESGSTPVNSPTFSDPTYNSKSL